MNVILNSKFVNMLLSNAHVIKFSKYHKFSTNYYSLIKKKYQKIFYSYKKIKINKTHFKINLMKLLVIKILIIKRKRINLAYRLAIYIVVNLRNFLIRNTPSFSLSFYKLIVFITACRYGNISLFNFRK